MLLIVSYQEAWRLYQQGFKIVEAKNIHSTGVILPSGLDFPYFLNKKRNHIFSLIPTNDEAKMLGLQQNKFFYAAFLGMITVSGGGILFGASFWSDVIKVNSDSYLGIRALGALMLLASSYCFVHLFEIEKESLSKLRTICDKYHIKDYYQEIYKK